MDFQESLKSEMEAISPNKHINEEFTNNILSEVNSALGGKVIRDNLGNITIIEIHDESLGNCWIDISINKDTQEIIIEKYFENEFLNEEYGITKRLPIQLDVSGNVVAIQAVVNSLL